MSSNTAANTENLMIGGGGYDCGLRTLT
jgi:hypothetical protein